MGGSSVRPSAFSPSFTPGIMGQAVGRFLWYDSCRSRRYSGGIRAEWRDCSEVAPPFRQESYHKNRPTACPNIPLRMNGPDDSSMHSVPTSCTISSHGPADTPVCHPPVCPPCTASPNKKPADTDAVLRRYIHWGCARPGPKRNRVQDRSARCDKFAPFRKDGCYLSIFRCDQAGIHQE